jgi:hypothetical protein
MEEDENTAQKREQLKKEREKLKSAMQKIVDLESVCAGYSIPRFTILHQDFQRSAASVTRIEEHKGKWEEV